MNYFVEVRNKKNSTLVKCAVRLSYEIQTYYFSSSSLGKYLAIFFSLNARNILRNP